MPKTESTTWFVEYAALFTKAHNLFCRWAGSHDITYQNLLLLMELSRREEGCGASELADCLFLPRQTMTYMLDCMEKEGRLCRFGHPTDRRRKVIRLTEQGQAFVQEVIAELREDFRAFGGLFSQDREEVLHEVKAFISVLEKKRSPQKRKVGSGHACAL